MIMIKNNKENNNKNIDDNNNNNNNNKLMSHSNLHPQQEADTQPHLEQLPSALSQVSFCFFFWNHSPSVIHEHKSEVYFTR